MRSWGVLRCFEVVWGVMGKGRCGIGDVIRQVENCITSIKDNFYLQSPSKK